MASRPKSALRIGLSAFLAASAMLGNRLMAAAPPEAEALAWRLDGISGSLLGPTQPNGAWIRSDALLQAAAKLNPSEPRFQRLRVLIMQHLGDTDGAIAAMRAYRTLVPQDHLAQAQLIDLYATKLETLDAKLAYLKGLLDKKEIAPEIRAHIAERCTQLLLQVSQQDAAAMAKRAVEIYPLAEATRQNYELSGRSKTPEERVALLMQLLKANPNQPAYLVELSRLLAGFNLLDSALQCYDTAIGVILNNGPARPADFHDLLVEYASLQIIAGHDEAANGILGQMLQQRPLDSDSWFLKLSMTKPGTAPDAQLIAFSRAALIQRWNAVHDDVLGIAPTTKPAEKPTTPPATQPAAVEPDEVASVVKKLTETPDATKKRTVVDALADLAWFEIYFANQPDAGQKWIDQLTTAAPEEAALIARLTGWKQLKSGQFEPAREALAKAGDADALAKFGLIQTDTAEKKPVDDATVSKLLADNRSGLTAAILWQTLRTDKTIPATQPSAEGVRGELQKFPRFWMSMVDPRATHRIYDLRLEPVTVTVPYGDPLLVQVTLLNQSDQDITVGAGSIIRPDLWFDGQTLGLDRQLFRGLAYDQITGELVLHAGASISQVVRVDIGPLRKLLDGSPATMTRVGGSCLTNPILTNEGAIPAPGGISGTTSRGINYMGLSVGMPADRKKLESLITSKDAIDRLHAVDVLAGYVNTIAATKTDENTKKAGADMAAQLEKLKSDSSPTVSAWAQYSAGAQTPATAEQMAKSADATTRLLALFVGPVAGQQAIAKTLAADADPLVKQAAAATLDLATQPTTAPADAASGSPFTRPAKQ